MFGDSTQSSGQCCMYHRNAFRDCSIHSLVLEHGPGQCFSRWFIPYFSLATYLRKQRAVCVDFIKVCASHHSLINAMLHKIILPDKNTTLRTEQPKSTMRNIESLIYIRSHTERQFDLVTVKTATFRRSHFESKLSTPGVR